MTVLKNIVVMLDLYVIRMGHLFISGRIPNPAGKAKNTTPTNTNANKLAQSAIPLMDIVDSLFGAGCSAEGTATRNPITNLADSVFDALALNDDSNPSAIEATRISPHELTTSENYQHMINQMDQLNIQPLRGGESSLPVNTSSMMVSPYHQVLCLT